MSEKTLEGPYVRRRTEGVEKFLTVPPAKLAVVLNAKRIGRQYSFHQQFVS